MHLPWLKRTPYEPVPIPVLLTLLWLGLQRLLWLRITVQSYPNREVIANANGLYDFWEVLLTPYTPLGSLQRSILLVNTLLVIWLWVTFRGVPRGRLAERVSTLLVFGGAAVLLAYFQFGVRSLDWIVPNYTVLRLDLASMHLSGL